MTKKKMTEITKQNLIEIAKQHKNSCLGEDCHVSLVLLLEVARDAGIKFTKEEMVAFA